MSTKITANVLGMPTSVQMKEIAPHFNVGISGGRDATGLVGTERRGKQPPDGTFCVALRPEAGRSFMVFWEVTAT